MTDIARPSNPALSFSSFNDEPVAYRMTAYPDRIEILSPSPRTTCTDDLESTDDDGRSKSAPPNPSRAKHELSQDEEVIVLSSTYDPRKLVRPDSAPPSKKNSPNDRQTASEKNRTRNPEIGVLHVLRTPNAGATTTLAVGGRSNLAAADEETFENPNRNDTSRLVSSDSRCERKTDAEERLIASSPRRSSFSQHFQEEEQHQTTTVDGRQLSRPIAQTPSRLSTLLTPPAQHEHRGGGTLILRPNPVKATEIIITTANLSPAELVRAAATATSPDKPEQQHCANEETTPSPEKIAANHHQEATKSTTEATRTAEEKKVSETWNTTQQARQAEKEAKRMLKEAQQQRKQEFQVDFPENNNATFVMPYAAATGEDQQSANMSNHNLPSRNEAVRMRHAPQHHHRDRMNSHRGNSGTESLGHRNTNASRTNEDVHADAARVVQPTPLFERLVTEEVQELKTYAGIVERQNVELAKQKKVQEDLEVRLRGETRRRKELESLLEEQERVWSEKFAELQEERNTTEKKLKDEQTKTKKLINQVQRKDRDIHDFFKKKYDHDGGRSVRSSTRAGIGTPSERNPQSSTASAARSAEFPQQSPQQLLNDLGSDEKVREGNAKNLLLDFFGI